jgi:hypothetical protein
MRRQSRLPFFHAAENTFPRYATGAEVTLTLSTVDIQATSRVATLFSMLTVRNGPVL